MQRVVTPSPTQLFWHRIGVVATVVPLRSGLRKDFLTWLASLQHLHHLPTCTGSDGRECREKERERERERRDDELIVIGIRKQRHQENGNWKEGPGREGAVAMACGARVGTS